MKITLAENMAHIPREFQSGITNFASFDRIIKAMQSSKELILEEDEYVAGITITEQGLAFKIEIK
jgi:hypothetical protein